MRVTEAAIVLYLDGAVALTVQDQQFDWFERIRSGRNRLLKSLSREDQAVDSNNCVAADKAGRKQRAVPDDIADSAFVVNPGTQAVGKVIRLVIRFARREVLRRRIDERQFVTTALDPPNGAPGPLLSSRLRRNVRQSYSWTWFNALTTSSNV